MTAKIIKRNENTFLVQIEVPYSISMLDGEELLQKALNEAGSLATGELLVKFDSDGSPIMVGDKKWTSKGKIPQTYQTPYGEARIERHVYQSSSGGRGYCPSDKDARIIITSTPKFAKMLTSKYSADGASRVLKDLEENHGRKISKLLLQNVSEAVGAVAMAKEEDWNYELPKMERPVRTVSIGLDGTCMLMTDQGWREAMVGTIGLYNYKGERQHTIYTAATPEYGKEKFLANLKNEVQAIKEKFPKATYIGLADGARENWEFLGEHSDHQILDFYHATGYLGKAAGVMFKDEFQRESWMEIACHNLKHNKGGAARLLTEVQNFGDENKLKEAEKGQIESMLTYFENNKPRMKYSDHVGNNWPIGSGITEAACKVIVKQRLCNSGMRWKDKGASVVLSLRCLNQTENRWGQFWNKIDRYGFPVAA